MQTDTCAEINKVLLILKTNNMKTSLSLVFLLFTALVKAQDPCPATKNGYVFQANRIGAFFSPRGLKFLNESDGFFKAPYTSENSASTIFACSPWMGGYVNNELHLTGQTFATIKQDLFVGPLSPGAIPYNNCDQFDRVWSVSRGEIEQHIQDFAIDGIIDDTLSNVFGWPAQGNTYFQIINGFDLPGDHQGGWADFADVNQNGIYEPQFGEYPIVHLKGQSQFPELISWMVFNDQGIHEQSNGLILGTEFQLTVFGFNCNQNYVLNNTIFNTYKIINQSLNTIDSIYFGMWTDYDLGCPSDDYLGCDSVRNTEFVYNDDVDGNFDTECPIGVSTYGYFPPVQSLTYLSHPMHSYIIDEDSNIGLPTYPSFMTAGDQYNLLTGNWPDGTSMYASGNGIHNSQDGPLTKFFLHGDPRDTAQWSWLTANVPHIDARPISSVYLNMLQPGEQAIVETAYSFHQDSTLDNLEQVGFMYQNIDALLEFIQDIDSFCQPPLACIGKDCVWPGDFNHNGIADHFDLLYWGVMLDSIGGKRDGLINWSGHAADPWALTLPDNLNAKHGDGNGDGQTNIEDLERNEFHFLLTNPYFIKKDTFPLGPEIRITASPMDTNGAIRRLEIKAQLDIPNVLGLAFELDFDTSFFAIDQPTFIFFPVDSNVIFFDSGEYTANEIGTTSEGRYAYVKSNHQSDTIKNGFRILLSIKGLKLKEAFSIDDLPDTIVIRLKNLIALDPNGNDLHIGANAVKVPKYSITGTANPGTKEPYVFIYPNPADQSISIETELESDCNIINLQGQGVKKILASDLHKPIDISNLSPGFYILQMLETGSSFKFTKQ
jgi:hypothetical protein